MGEAGNSKVEPEQDSVPAASSGAPAPVPFSSLPLVADAPTEVLRKDNNALLSENQKLVSEVTAVKTLMTEGESSTSSQLKTLHEVNEDIRTANEKLKEENAKIREALVMRKFAAENDRLKRELAKIS